MEPTYVVAVDSGKDMTKGVLIKDGVIKKEDRFSIKTRLTETMETRAKTAGTHVVTMNGMSTIIGIEDEFPSTSRTKKEDVHRRATYLSISRLVPNGGTVALAIGTPVREFLMDEMMKNYEAFMLGHEDNPDFQFREPVEIRFNVDGEDFNYTIESLYVYPEAGGFVFKNQEDYVGLDIGIVDIGGLNINGSMYGPPANGDINSPIELNHSNNISENEGIHFFINKLMKELNDELGLSLTERDVRRSLPAGAIGKGGLREKSTEIINRNKEEYVRRVRSLLSLNKWSVETMDLIFIGGGAALLNKQILKQEGFTDATIPESPEWENVEGFAILTENDVLSRVTQ